MALCGLAVRRPFSRYAVVKLRMVGFIGFEKLIILSHG